MLLASVGTRRCLSARAGEGIVGTGCSPGEDFDVLIGMDLLGWGDLAIFRDGFGTFSFDSE